MSKRNFIPPPKLSDYITIEGGRKLYLTEHSKQRIKARGISDEDIRNTYQNPDITVPNTDYSNAKNYMKKINERNDTLKRGKNVKTKLYSTTKTIRLYYNRGRKKIVSNRAFKTEDKGKGNF